MHRCRDVDHKDETPVVSDWSVPSAVAILGRASGFWSVS